MERTYLMVKPDGVKRQLVGEIIRRFEARGLRLVGLKLLQPDRALAEKHYEVHKERPFFGGLVDFIISGPVVGMAWEGPNAISIARKMMGATKPEEALPGTIRGDFATEIEYNIIHGSDAPETAAIELALWFKPEELLD